VYFLGLGGLTLANRRKNERENDRRLTSLRNDRDDHDEHDAKK
jgi:hypothetical protein